MSTGLCLTRQYLCAIVAMTIATTAAAQNYQHLQLSGADSMFLNKNLYLLAASLNVNAQSALEIQSRSYPNPQFSAEINARDPQNDKWFHAGNTGEKAFAIEQVILLGGKRKNEIAIAKQSTEIAKYELEDLLRNLRYQLHNSYYSIYFDELTLQKYNKQLELLDTIISNYEIQADKGNISVKEVVRLKSVYLQLNNNKTELLQDIQEEQKNLQVLLQTQDYITPEIDDISWSKFNNLPPIDSMMSLAFTNRADWKIARGNTALATLNLKYQKSLAIPDLSLGASYDQRGGAFNNQVNMTAGIPIPLWNHNKGNIRFARESIKIAEVNADAQTATMNAEIIQAWSNMLRCSQEYQKSIQLYNKDFSAVFDGITDNFRKRNISMLEFVDFFESYNESLAEINRIRKQLIQSAESVNHVTATIIY